MAAIPNQTSEFADFVRTFTEATSRLQETHVALSSQVERLQAELAEANERLRRSRSLAAVSFSLFAATRPPLTVLHSAPSRAGRR